MIEKYLGKIDFAEYGTIKDYPFMIGLQLGFAFNGCGVMDGGKYTVNISKECRWEEREAEEVITNQTRNIYKILCDAKCNYISELIGKPVELTIENNAFKEFRILTEVL
jgi:hypothetical protein